MTIILDDLLDLSRTPGAVCQSIHSRNAPEVVAGTDAEYDVVAAYRCLPGLASELHGEETLSSASV